jgi:hypothetical protein
MPSTSSFFFCWSFIPYEDATANTNLLGPGSSAGLCKLQLYDRFLEISDYDQLQLYHFSTWWTSTTLRFPNFTFFPTAPSNAVKRRQAPSSAVIDIGPLLALMSN